MTKMAATPIYGKNPSKIFTRTGGPIPTKLGTYHWGLQSIIVCSYDDQWIDLDLEPLFLIGSFSFLRVTRTTIKAWISLNFGEIPSLTSELAALEHLKNRTINLLAL